MSLWARICAGEASNVSLFFGRTILHDVRPPRSLPEDAKRCIQESVRNLRSKILEIRRTIA